VLGHDLHTGGFHLRQCSRRGIGIHVGGEACEHPGAEAGARRVQGRGANAVARGDAGDVHHVYL
jgi:hypothetical protein